jgi:hypothetical protein
MSQRSDGVSRRGASSSENAGMSSERGVRNPSAESPRVPGEGYSPQGKSGAKARPKGVVDAQLVDIPVPPCSRQAQELQRGGCSLRGAISPSGWRVTEGGRRRVGEPGRWLSPGKRVGGSR